MSHERLILGTVQPIDTGDLSPTAEEVLGLSCAESSTGSAETILCPEIPLPSRPFPWSRLKLAGLVVIAILVTILAFSLDQQVDAFVRTRGDSHWKQLAWFMTRYGDWPFLMLYALIFFIVGVGRKSRRWKSLALAMALTCFLTGVSSTAIRYVTGRTRPHVTSIAQGWYGIRHDSQWIIGNADFNSFPSGHVGAAVGFVMPLALGTRRGRLPALLFCLLLAWARVYTGYHHVSDVVVAAIIGITGGLYLWNRIKDKIMEPG